MGYDSAVRYLSQINIGRLVAPLDDPRIADFVAQLDAVNGLAERSPGFVWRLKSEGGNATDIPYSNDPLMLVNMSVWESVEALRAFTYLSQHSQVLRERARWFEKAQQPTGCLWWIPEGHVPTVEEGHNRLEHFRKYGPTEHAFWFSRVFD